MLLQSIHNKAQQRFQDPVEAEFVKGEKLDCKYNLKEISSSQNLIGDLYLSNFKLFFKPNGVKLD